MHVLFIFLMGYWHTFWGDSLVCIDGDPTKIFFQSTTHEPITADYTLQTVLPGKH